MNMLTNILGRYRHQQDPLRSERRIELFLIALLLLVLLQLTWLGLATLRTSTIEPVPPAADSLRVVAAVDPGFITAPQSLLLQSRPLFWSSRRPATALPPVEDAAALAQQSSARRLENVEVTGMIGSGAQGAVILSYKGEFVRLSVGDTLDGWSVQSVTPAEAVFVSAGARDVRRLLPLPVKKATTAVDFERANGANEVSETTLDSRARAVGEIQEDQAKDVERGSLSLGGF